VPIGRWSEQSGFDRARRHDLLNVDLVTDISGFDAALRRCALGASLVYDIDAVPGDEGVLVGGDYGPILPWSALAPHAHPAPESTDARYRVGRVLLAAKALDELLATGGWGLLEARLRVLALPDGHLESPGSGWGRRQVHGGVLTCGIGVQGLLGNPDRTDPLPIAVTSIWGRRMQHLLDDAWSRCIDHAERMGELAVARIAREGQARGVTSGVLRPVGGCDVVTLLATSSLRRYLAASDGTGMRAVAVPMRDRGWFDLARIDPVFVGAAWMATEEPDRGLSRAVLVTADEVTLAPVDCDPTAVGLDLPGAR
jgi:hypothetical protein